MLSGMFGLINFQFAMCTEIPEGHSFLDRTQMRSQETSFIKGDILTHIQTVRTNRRIILE